MDSPDLFSVDDAIDELDAHFQLRLDGDSPQATNSILSRPTQPLLSLPNETSQDACSTGSTVVWSLISPCSEPPLSPSPQWAAIPAPAYDEATKRRDEEDEPVKDVAAESPEPEASPKADSHRRIEDEKDEKNANAMEDGFRDEEEEEPEERFASSSGDEEDEEVEVFNAETPTSAHLARKGSMELDGELLDSVTEVDELDDVEVSSNASSHFLDDSLSEGDGSVVSRPSLVAAGGKWVGRIKARTYSGSASITQAYHKIRARTLSATSTPLGPSSGGAYEGDDGGFSSDDEDFNHDRRSQCPASSASSTGSSSRLSSINMAFPTKLGAVKSVKLLSTSVPSFMRFRSSSSATTTSDDGGVERSRSGSGTSVSGSGLPSDDGTGGEDVKEPLPLTTHMGMYKTQELKQKATACASRAAGLFNAASAEAARKIKKSSLAFRSSSSQPSPSAMDASSSSSSPVLDAAAECFPGPPGITTAPSLSPSITTTLSAAASG